jgi:hypothetical protein
MRIEGIEEKAEKSKRLRSKKGTEVKKAEK